MLSLFFPSSRLSIYNDSLFSNGFVASYLLLTRSRHRSSTSPRPRIIGQTTGLTAKRKRIFNVSNIGVIWVVAHSCPDNLPLICMPRQTTRLQRDSHAVQLVTILTWRVLMVRMVRMKILLSIMILWVVGLIDTTQILAVSMQNTAFVNLLLRRRTCTTLRQLHRVGGLVLWLATVGLMNGGVVRGEPRV